MSFFTGFRRRPAQAPATAPPNPGPDDPAPAAPTVEAAAPPEPAAPPEAAEPAEPEPTGDEPVGGESTADAEPAGGGEPVRGRSIARRVGAWVATFLACALVLVGLVAPDQLGQLTPGAFLRIPVEALVGVVFVLVLPVRARRWVMAVAGAILGVVTVLKVVDMGFYEVLARPFDPVLDWQFLVSAVDFLAKQFGRAGSIVAVVVTIVLVIAVTVFTALSVLRLTRIVARHRTAAGRSVAVFGVAWVTCAVLGVALVPGLPVASDGAAVLAFSRADGVRVSILDHREFAAQAAVDAFRGTPGDQLLTGLRGKDFLLTFVESYGRVALDDPAISPGVDKVLADETTQLRAAGYSARTAFLTSPTAGGGSWLAHATLLSGLWVDNQQRYQDLVTSDRFTLTRAFKKADWQTVAVMPSTTGPWPEATFYGYDRVYDANNLGYKGPRFQFSTIPDQYTLAHFERTEHGVKGHPPMMVEMPLVSSHGPWVPLARTVDWHDVGDGTIYQGMDKEGESPEAVYRDRNKVKAQYGKAIQYSLTNLLTYLADYGDDNTVMVFLGDHQPAPIVTGENPSRDVPITIVARDKSVLDRVAGWGWQDGLRPRAGAPIWPMNAFRDKFLTAFGGPPAGH